MAAPAPPLVSPPPPLSRKQRRTASRKERRKRKRQTVAQARECALKNGDVCQTNEEEDEGADDEDDDVSENERRRLHEEWLERERLAQEAFRLRSEREEAATKRKQDEERMIKEEWEAQQRREQEAKEQKQQEKRDREHKQPSFPLRKALREKALTSTFSSHIKDEAVQKILDEAENQLDHDGPWMNPEAPAAGNSENYGTEKDTANCPFFLKTGACRFGDRCSRKHVHPTVSPTLMIRGMFITFGMEESRRDDYDIDACLEHSEEELQESFLDFYHDVLPEFKSVGKVVQFKVSCNYEPHLRGNVYVQFDTAEQCQKAFLKFNGRWYASKQLQCEICPVTRWKNAICGLFDRHRCPKGKHCNFLHVFRNPGNEFWEADRDLHLSPDRSVSGSHRDGWQSERFRERLWRQHHSSRSPLRSERSHSRGEDDRSRERRMSHQKRDDRRSNRGREPFQSRSRDRWRSRERGRSRSRDRGRSRSRERERPRHRSRDKDGKHKKRNKSEERESKENNMRARDRSRSINRDGENKQSRGSSVNGSPENPEERDEGKRARRHKHSKKSKKKSKKSKKKHHLPEGTSSSRESEKEQSEDETEEKDQATTDDKLLQENNEANPSGDQQKKSSPEVES